MRSRSFKIKSDLQNSLFAIAPTDKERQEAIGTMEQTAVLGLLEQTAARKEGSAWLEEPRGGTDRLAPEWQVALF